MLRTYSDNILVKSAFAVAITAASTNGTSVDTLGYGRCAAVFYGGPTGSGTTSDCKLQESSTGSSGWADVSGAAFAQATTAGGAQIGVLNVDLSKRLRYLRLVHTGAGGSAAGLAWGAFHLLNGEGAPPAQDLAAVSV
jgi:hypothetical protein